MRFPVNRQALAARNQLDDRDELLHAASETPLDRVLIALQLSELSRKVAASAAGSNHVASSNDLQQKAVLYSQPLRVLVK